MKRATVIQPIADLRKGPQELFPKDYSHNSLRDSQLLFGEPLLIHRQESDYYYVEALEQKKFTPPKGWHGYFGWVKCEEVRRIKQFQHANLIVASPWASLFHDPRGCYPTRLKLSYGTALTGEKHQKMWKLFAHGHFLGFGKDHSFRLIGEDRDIFHREALGFLNTPYLWGGRGANVDCSGLLSLLFKSQGIFIPRDAHDQYLKGNPIEHTNLRQGDALYLRKAENSRVTHVILCLEKGLFIESPQTGETVRLLREGQEIAFEGAICRIKGREAPYVFFCRRFN